MKEKEGEEATPRFGPRLWRSPGLWLSLFLSLFTGWLWQDSLIQISGLRMMSEPGGEVVGLFSSRGEVSLYRMAGGKAFFDHFGNREGTARVGVLDPELYLLCVPGMPGWGWTGAAGHVSVLPPPYQTPYAADRPGVPRFDRFEVPESGTVIRRWGVPYWMLAGLGPLIWGLWRGGRRYRARKRMAASAGEKAAGEIGDPINEI